MSGTLPSTPKFSGVSIKSVFPGVSVESDTGKVQRLNFPGHYFEIEAQYPALKKTEAKPLLGFLQSQQGSLSNFSMQVPAYSTTSGSGYTLHLANTPTIDTRLLTQNSELVNATTIEYNSAWTSTYYNQSTDGDFLIVGDYISFANHNKVYQITAVTQPDASGNGTITISPGLQDAVPSSTQIEYYDITWNVFLTNVDQGFSGATNDFVDLSITVREEQ